MQKRQFIIVGIAILILVLGRLAMQVISTPEEKQKAAPVERIATVFAETVHLHDIPVHVSSTGSLEAIDRMELYSETQGLMLPDNGRFKAGNSFQKGQTLIRLRADDAYAGVVAQRSSFERSLSAVMADIRLDYPANYDTWRSYLRSIDVNAALPDLPEVNDPTLKSFLTGQDIYTSYYNVRNAEIALSRYVINAPYNGVLTEANADPGTVVRQGQALGIFLKPGRYELKASTDAATASTLHKGQSVSLHADGEENKEYNGHITRINASIDAQTQMTDFFVEVFSDELKDGQFLRVNVAADEIKNAFELDRATLYDSKFVYVVKDNVLRAQEITILHRTENTVIVSGLTEGDVVLSKLPPTAFDGMKVKIYSEAKGA